MNKMITCVEKYAFTQIKKESSKNCQQGNINIQHFLEEFGPVVCIIQVT